MRAIIVDDEKLAITGLEKLLSKYCPQIDIIASCTTFKEALKAINELKPEVVFSDIEMPQANGFELLETVGFKDFKLIFTTAHLNYALQAIKVEACDYLLKPIDPDELIEAVNKASKDTEEKLTIDDNRLIINTQDSIFYINQEDIMFLKSDGNYTAIKVKNGKTIMVSQTLKKLEERLEDSRFTRTHHSYIVNQTEIFEFNKTNLKLTLNDGTVLPVSIRKKKYLTK